MAARPVFHEDLGALLVSLRKDRNFGQRQVAKIAERRGLPLSQQVLLRLEKGKTKNVEPETLRALASIYGLSYEELAGWWIKHRYGVKTAATDHAPTTIEGFVALPLLATPIAAGQPLAIAPDPGRDRTLSFRETVVRKFTRPLCLRIGPREESMLPTLEPGDVIVIDQNPDRRRSPKTGHIYAVNFGPLTGEEGGAIKRIYLSGGTMIVSSDNTDKRAYPPQAFNMTDVDLLAALVGEVVWTGRYLGSGKKADVRRTRAGT